MVLTTIHYNRHIFDFAFCNKSVEQLHIIKMRIIQAQHIYNNVCNTARNESIRYKTHRCCIDNYIIIFFS